MAATQVIVFERHPSLEPLVRQGCVSKPVRVRAVRSVEDASSALLADGRSILIVQYEAADGQVFDVLSRVPFQRHWIVVVPMKAMTRQVSKAIRERGACCIVPFSDRRSLLLPLLGRLLNLSQSYEVASNGLDSLMVHRALIDG